MHIDSRQLDDQALIEGDICIVGSGAAGISIALEWKDTPYKVILLESGGFEYEEQIQNLHSGTVSGQLYYPLRSCRLRYFGGTTGHWAGMCSPYDPIDFEKRDWVPGSGWPISRKDMDPYYARANEVLGLGPYEYELPYWREKYPQLVPFALDEEVVWNKMWQFSNARFNGQQRDNITKAKNIHLYTYASVVDIQANEAVHSVDSLTVRQFDGKIQQVKAKHYILACGAVQNARLLLASNSRVPAGLGNQNDQVGRYFMEHLEIASADLWLLKDHPKDLYILDWFNGDPLPTSAELALTPKVQQEKQILNGTASLISLEVAKGLTERMIAWQDGDPRSALDNFIGEWINQAKKVAEETEGEITRAYQLNTRIEQAPNPNSRVTLIQEKDALGVPQPNLNWELTALDKRSIHTLYSILGEQMGKAGIGRIQIREHFRDPEDMEWPDGTNGGWHHMGTTRMSDDPKTGVTDRNCQVHGLSNLYVAGSGCFTTAGAPNPTLTVVALSLRLSDYVKAQMNT